MSMFPKIIKKTALNLIFFNYLIASNDEQHQYHLDTIITTIDI